MRGRKYFLLILVIIPSLFCCFQVISSTSTQIVIFYVNLSFFFRKQSAITIHWKRNTTAILTIKSDKMMKHNQNRMAKLISWKNNTKRKRNTLKFVGTSLYLIANSGLYLKSKLHNLLRKYLHLTWKTLEIFMILRLTKKKLIRLIGLRLLRKFNPGQFSSLSV